MRKLKEIDILDKVLDPEFWDIMMERKTYTGHQYYNSPYESSDSCKTCDGARCETCKEIIIPEDIECSIRVDKLENILTNMGLPTDVVMFFTYDDSCKMSYKGYHMRFPNVKDLKERYPDKYKELHEAATLKIIKEREELKMINSNNVNKN